MNVHMISLSNLSTDFYNRMLRYIASFVGDVKRVSIPWSSANCREYLFYRTTLSLCIAQCLSSSDVCIPVRPSVCLSVTLAYCIETAAKDIVKLILGL